MKKRLAAILSAMMLITATACSASDDGENTQPEIIGVSDRTVEAGQEFNALEGITAQDAEDGDITAKIVVEAMPGLEFKNGKVVPDKAGSYELTYSVTDRGGLTVEEYATLTVTRQTGEAVLYREFDFSDIQPADNGWNARIADGVSANGETKQGAFVFDISSAGNGDGDIQFVMPGLALKEADYRIRIWAKSTKDTYAHILARDEGTEEWRTFGGAYNVVIGQEITPLELNFTSAGDGSAEILLNLGKITPNPDEPSNTTPEDFTVTIDKVEIYEISGEETRTPVFVNDFSSSEENAVILSAGDGASGEVVYEDGAAVVEIQSYPTEGGVWSIKGDISLPDVTIEAGTKYYYSFTLNALNAQAGECLVESATQYDGNRVHFNGFSASAGEETVISGVFTAESAVADPVIRLQIGSPSEGVTTNSLHIDNVEFGKVEGDLETVKSIYTFTAFGKGTVSETDSSRPWSTFNGTDEDNERGVGTIWTENGSFFYRIDQGGTVDWHNKLICGYSENPLVLESDSYYTIEITVKASRNVSCGFFLNPLGGWDPRISEAMDITTEEQTFTFTTKDTFITDMSFEMLFQFGSEQTAQNGEVTIEISDLKIYQMKVL